MRKKTYRIKGITCELFVKHTHAKNKVCTWLKRKLL